MAVLRSLGFGFGSDNLGQGNLALDYVSVLRPNYVKLAPAICRQVDEHNISVITAIANTVGNLNIPLYATNVETETQLQLLQAAGINGFQGFINPTHID